ncbi:hypothetical protein Zmor_023790 [Zophobas morio]|uniref:Tetratricopeptide repeat protein 36 n=1 Tax=Zophobas morio TaxID=2755281 RepID=A0AA38M7K9_9CUCU|nr:hypothetical protein Zmor_023790 [Zophobas morio]
MSELSEHDAAVLNSVLYPNLPLPDTAQKLEDVEDNTPEVQQTKKMEAEAVQMAENGKFEEALELLNKAVDTAPKRASVYNNRAHVYQFQKRFSEALDDLTKAIELAQNNQKRTLSQALCQRGILHRRASRFDLAREDFETAAQMGSQFAKSQLVEMNPYAALCNQMLRKVMEDL